MTARSRSGRRLRRMTLGTLVPRLVGLSIMSLGVAVSAATYTLSVPSQVTLSVPPQVSISQLVSVAGILLGVFVVNIGPKFLAKKFGPLRFQISTQKNNVWTLLWTAAALIVCTLALLGTTPWVLILISTAGLLAALAIIPIRIMSSRVTSRGIAAKSGK